MAGDGGEKHRIAIINGNPAVPMRPEFPESDLQQVWYLHQCHSNGITENIGRISSLVNQTFLSTMTNPLVSSTCNSAAGAVFQKLVEECKEKTPDLRSLHLQVQNQGFDEGQRP